nr:solute carrier family 35 member C2 isoform X2 [Pongo pygmaeus]XP_054323541.1 solute carrier family 35 member C2 isoform X2 [Pongo pygmaeus]XP_054323542.1 solute carrier family 35 member C2 isoform X2 [Pongo pygmaeus]
MSPSRCEYWPCPAASLQAEALCLSSGVSAYPAARPATPPLWDQPLLSQPLPGTQQLSGKSPASSRAALVLVVLLIAGGLFMFTYKSTQFNMEGFALVLGASFIGGIRWTLTQMLLQKAELGLQNPIDTMFHLQPLMFLGLFPLFAIFEGLHLSTSEKIFRFQDTGLLLRVLGSLFLGGILAFGLGFSEFLLVSRTSSLTLSIAGIFKEVCTLLLAAHLLGDQISLLNWLGFALCLSGISLHVALKALHSRGDGGPKALKGLGSSPDLELLLRSSQREEGDNEEEEYFVAQGQQ